ncbi:carbohydrate ABC transporter permease [Chlamydiota bacterium]
MQERAKKTKISSNITESIVLHFFLLMMLFLTLLPFIWMLSTSFKEHKDIFTLPPQWIPLHPTIENYKQLFKEGNFLRYFLNSVIISTTLTFLGLFINSMAGFVFSKYRFFGKDRLFTLLLATMMVPAQVTMIPVFLMLKYMGLLNNYLGLIIPASAAVFSIFLMRQFILGIPNDIIEAARIDGCTDFGIYCRVILPLCKPVLATIMIFTFMGSWNAFLWPLIVMLKDSMYTLPVALANLSGGAHGTDYGILMAGSVLVVLPIIIIFLLMQKHYIKGIAMTGLKG